MCSVVDPRDFEQQFVYHRQPSSSDFSLLVFLLKSFMKRFFSRGGYFHYRPIQPQDGALLLITTSTFRPLGLVSDQSLSCEVFDVLFRFQGRNCKTDKRVSVRGGFSRSSKTAERSELKVVFFFLSTFSDRLRHRAPPKLGAHLQHLGAGESVQVGRLHGHAARQMVQGGALWETQLRRDGGKNSATCSVYVKVAQKVF